MRSVSRAWSRLPRNVARQPILDRVGASLAELRDVAGMLSTLEVDLVAGHKTFEVAPSAARLTGSRSVAGSSTNERYPVSDRAFAP